jgi:hypothetical protein
MTLTKGARYRARLRLGIFEGLASNATIEAKLEEAGFADVTVTGSGRDRFAEGMWGRLTAAVELPDQVVAGTVVGVA